LDKTWFSSDAFHSIAEFAAQVRDIAATYVAQLYAFQLRPEPFVGVQLGGIGREAFQVNPLCGTIRQELLDDVTVVNGGAIPNDYHTAGHLAQQVFETGDDASRIEGTVLAAEVLFSAKILAPSLWTASLPAATIAEGRHRSQRDSLAMIRYTRLPHYPIQLAGTLLKLLVDALRYVGFCLRSPATLAAENLFLRKQLALYRERNIKPRRATPATRIALIWLARWCDWRHALVIVQPQTSTRWHRQGFRVFWRWTSRPGRPPIPADLRALIRRMARENPTWGEERLANERRLKLGWRVSPRSVRRYLPKRLDRGGHHRVSSPRRRTFVRHHAQAIIACDFCVVVTATFRLLFVFVVMEHARRKILHVNVTAHPTAAWTLQQLREAAFVDHGYRFLIHDRDRIFSQQLDQQVRHLGLRVLKTPVRSPQAHVLCERLLGTLRRECVDFMIPLTEHHLRCILKAWVQHDNQGRPHMSLGPGIPQPPPPLPAPLHVHRHKLPVHLHVAGRPILGGLHHEYQLEERAA
jgi:putative transposase